MTLSEKFFKIFELEEKRARHAARRKRQIKSVKRWRSKRKRKAYWIKQQQEKKD